MTHRHKDNRLQIANIAADILLEDGNHNVQHAKMKAAKQLNFSQAADMPSNQLIDSLLLAKQKERANPKQQGYLHSKRKTALQAMKSFEQFNPRASGPVASGTADQHSPIILHLFSDSAEEVLFHLMDSKIPWKEAETRINSSKGKKVSLPTFNFMAGEHPVTLICFPTNYFKQPAVLANNDEPELRLKYKKLEKLLNLDINEYRVG